MIDSLNFPTNINLANYYWNLGKKKLSRQHAKTAAKINPSSTMVRLNKAFYRFFDRNYSGVIRLFKKIEDMEDMRSLDICEFIEDEYEKKLNKLGLLFAFSSLSINFGDYDRGKIRLQEFISKAQGDNQYIELINEAKKILTNIS